MYPNEFIELIVAAKGQFAECDILKKLNKFFGDTRDVWDGEIRKPWVFIFLFSCHSLARMDKGI